MFKRIFIIILIVELFIITFLSIGIKNRLNSKVLITPINSTKKNTNISSDSHLEYFYEPKSNSIQNSSELLSHEAVVTINNDALNERFDYKINKPKNTFRIITLGDSFTYGVGVNTFENWPEQLEDMLNYYCNNNLKFEVINLGVGGYDVEYCMERYRLRGEKYNPDLIIWMFIDLLRMDEYLLPIYEEISNGLKRNNQELKLIREGRYNVAFTEARQNVIDKLGEEAIYNFQKIQMRKISQYFTGRLVLVGAPRQLWHEERLILSEFSNFRKNTFFFDNLIDIYSSKDYVLPDQHPSSKGHQVIAQDVYDYLIKNKLVTCN